MTKHQIRQWIEKNANPQHYVYCECGEPIATIWVKWKYKYCQSCTLAKIRNYQKEIGRKFQGNIRYGQIKADYWNGRRWKKDSCDVCGFTEALDVHRIVPGKEGGLYTIDNTATLCPNCHALVSRKKKFLRQGRNRLYHLVDLPKG